jgi:transcriptional regulator with XRE-family HTH domain
MLSFAADVGVAQGFISNVCSGKKRPLLERIEAWAEVLKLRGRERQRFIDLAILQWIPDEDHRARVERLMRGDRDGEDDIRRVASTKKTYKA